MLHSQDWQAPNAEATLTHFYHSRTYTGVKILFRNEENPKIELIDTNTYMNVST
jgi:hypothetical protein